MDKRKYIWGIRTSDSNRTSHGGFQWPEKGWVEAPDWNPQPECGGGLHFLPWGVGNGSLLDWSTNAIWQVVRDHSPEVVDLGGKSKAPRLEVMFSGDRDEAFILLDKHRRTSDGIRALQGGVCGDHGIIAGGSHGRVAGGNGSTVTGGNGSTVTGGHYSTVSGGDCSTVTGGIKSTVSGGYGSTVTGGDYSTVSGGIGSTLSLRYWDGSRFRTSIAYVGERAPGMTEGEVIDPGVAYRIEAGNCRWIQVEDV